MGTNLIQLSCHTLRDQTHPTATATHAGTNHIQLAPPNSWPPIISNCHRQIHGYQSHPIIIATHVGTKHIQLSSPYTWAPTKSNCYRLTREPHPTATRMRAQTTNWHHQTRGYQSHPIAVATHLGIKYIQLNTWGNHQLLRLTWATNHTHCHSHKCGHKPHQPGNTKLVGTNHIQLPWPHTWASNTSNCHSHTRGHQPHPTGTTRFVSTNHIQLPCPHT